MESEKQTFDEFHSLVSYQNELQRGYIKAEIKNVLGGAAIIFILFIIMAGFISGDFLIALGFFGPIFLFPILLFLASFERDKIRYYKGIQELYILTKGTDKKIEDYNQIIIILKRLKNILRKKSNKYIGMGPLEAEMRYNQNKYFEMVQKNIQTDLAYRIMQEKTALESAKSEVESTIKGSSELAQVSELQKARLDSQIEQFEKLQKVLLHT